jgi:hypothetical protein
MKLRYIRAQIALLYISKLLQTMGNKRTIINDCVNKITEVRFKIFTAVIMKNTLCRAVTPCVR